MEGEKVRLRAFIVQLLATLSIAGLVMLTGFIFAWPSYTITSLLSNTTSLARPLTSFEGSLISSLPNVGALVATPCCGYIVDRLGRKRGAMLFGLPCVITWATLALTTNVTLAIMAVGIAGFAAAGQVVSSIYIAEIAQDSIRGAMTSSVVWGYFSGLLFSYIIGGRLSYSNVIYVHLGLSVVYILTLSLLHESPVFLMQKGKEEAAAKSIAFYRQVEITSKEVEMEIMKIKVQLDPNIDNIILDEKDPETASKLLESKIDDNKEVETKSISAWKFLCQSETSKRALTTVLVLMASTILMGSVVLQVYAEPLFAEAVPSLPPNLCAVVLAIVFLVSSLLCAFLVDLCGRKLLMTVTAIVSGALTLALGAQLQLHWAPHWGTAVLIYAYCFVYTVGAATVPFILPAEVFLPEVRGLCNSLAMACQWIMNFVTVFIFNYVVAWWGLGTAFYLFAAVSLLVASYSHFCLPETRGLSADAIQPLFLKKKT